MATLACTVSGAMFVGSQARLVVGVWHALGGMGLWQCWFVVVVFFFAHLIWLIFGPKCCVAAYYGPPSATQASHGCMNPLGPSEPCTHGHKCPTWVLANPQVGAMVGLPTLFGN